MARFSRGYRIIALTIVLVFIGFHMLSVTIERKAERGQTFSAFDRAVLTVYQPFYTVITWPFRTVADLWHSYAALVGLRAENDELAREVQRLQAKLAELGELRHEVGELREYVEFVEENHRPVATGRVVGRSFVPELRTVLVNRGSTSGVEPGMVAVTHAGLVGHVTGVARGVSRVRLINDSLSAVHVVLQDSRATGVVKGNADGRCRLFYTKWTDEIAEGEVIVTSGQDLFPGGLFVGRVEKVSRPEGSAEREVIVETAVDLDRIEVVVILAPDAHREEMDAFDEFVAPPVEDGAP